MRNIILVLILMIVLSGCNDFTIPDDTEFIALVESLKTPNEISLYMRNNFDYKANLLYTKNPYQLWKTEIGDCSDFATFGTFIADYHDYRTYIIKTKQTDGFKHWLGVYKEFGHSYTDNQYYYPARCETFREVVEDVYQRLFAEWTSYKVYDNRGNLVEEGKNG